MKSPHCLPIIILLVFIIVTARVGAKTHVVIVKDNLFSPANIVIEAGDTVRWENQGPSAHNVYALGKFRCADGCDATGGNGNPSATAWVSEVTFRIPELVFYECQPHLAFGMVGSVLVKPPSTGAVYSVSAELDNTFNPHEMKIIAGDVLFVNNQGGEHNFQMADDSLICAEGCLGDGQFVSTAPTGFPWEFYARFNQVGEFPFYCANPDHQGQTGLLRVLSDAIFVSGFEVTQNHYN